MKILSVIFILCCSLQAGAQSQSDSVNRKRLNTVLISGGIGYTAGLIGLNQLWYSKFPREKFHFFNDNSQWLQIDKVGHFYTSFHLANSTYSVLRWTGLEKRKSYLWGSIAGATLLLPIEIMDGFSSEFGASYGDIIANTLGAGLFYSQQLAWGENRIKPKFSFNRSSLSSQRPNVLGDGLHEELLKDYNGQTYWLVFDMDRFNVHFLPSWINLAVGYGGYGMISASRTSNISQGLNPTRQYYLALDFDLTTINTRSKFLKTVFHALDLIHLPAPAIEYNKRQNLKAHLLFF